MVPVYIIACLLQRDTPRPVDTPTTHRCTSLLWGCVVGVSVASDRCPSSTLINQTFTCSMRRYCDNRHQRTFLWRHFHITISSQEQEREVRISATHVHWLPRGTSVQKRVLAACIIPILSCLNVLRNLSWRRNFSHIFHTLSFIVFRFGLLSFYVHNYVRFCNYMSMRFYTTILCVFGCEKTCGLRFHNTSQNCDGEFLRQLTVAFTQGYNAAEHCNSSATIAMRGWKWKRCWGTDQHCVDAVVRNTQCKPR